MSPVTAATTNTHAYSPHCTPKPIGVHIQQTKEPISYKILSSISTICHCQEKLERNQMTMAEATMMVNAFFR